MVVGKEKDGGVIDYSFMKDLIAGYNAPESARIEGHFKRLLPHLESEKFVIVGGLAIQFQLKHRAVNYPKRKFNDLDIVLESADVLLPTITDKMLVSHHHIEGSGHYFALVDPETRTKIDVFNSDFYPYRYDYANFNGVQLRVQSLEDQLVKTIYDIQRISSEAKVDPKQFNDAELMMGVADINLANENWQKRQIGQYPTNIMDAWRRAKIIRQQHPDWIVISPFKKDIPGNCPECIDDPKFPLADKSEIFSILEVYE